MQIINFYGNPNIGLFFYSTNKFTIAPKITSDETIKLIEKELKTKIIKADAMNSSVNAIFFAGNDEILLAPKKIDKESIKEIEKMKIKIELIDTNLNALGNNMVIHGKKALINPNFEESAIKQIENLGIKTIKSKIAGVETVGANLVIFKNKGLINNKASELEIKKIEDFLEISIEKGTVNNKSPIIKAGFCKNDSGIIISSEMTGPEMMALEEMMK
ncbi:MAG: translation initiation factor IF-6 [Candidatus Nanoarchaeia archaeon]|nr:translation initiation factor IF-6 [Candidatus Nanoarchaeia archaeon]MDD5054103.1 translation initiation factor IF-6 [Candidatus Nanoarchaeia archaeon]MDD5499497.1 translation initiation factor IF-6 [Candidatus Nanoarchaeia archaeon]